MSEENVELARRGYAAFRDAGEEALFEYLDVDVEMNPVEELPGAQRYRGHDGFRRFFETLRDAFGEFTWEAREFVDLADHVLIETNFIAEGRGSGIPVEMAVYIVWTFRDGKAVRVRSYTNRDDALADARRSGRRTQGGERDRRGGSG